MSAILNYLNAHNFPSFEPIFMILVSKFMVHRVLSEKTYLPLGLLSPLIRYNLTFVLALVYSGYSYPRGKLTARLKCSFRQFSN